MKRSMFQAYVKDSRRAVALYQRAFDAKLLDSYLDPDGSYYHSELDVYGQVLAVSEAAGEVTPGESMQFCLHFEEGEEDRVRRAYDALKDGGTVLFPLGSCDYSPLMADLVDPFGVRWCVFIC